MLLNALTIELRILLRKRRVKLEGYKTGVKRRLTFIVPAQEAKSGPPLAPILGQVQINTSDFAESFNARSIEFSVGFPVRVELLVNWDKTYSFNFLPIPFHYFIQNFTFSFFDDLQYIDCYLLFKYTRIFKLLYNVFFSNEEILYSHIVSVLQSHDYGISFFSKKQIFKFIKLLLFKYFSIFNFYFSRLNPTSPIRFNLIKKTYNEGTVVNRVKKSKLKKKKKKIRKRKKKVK